MKSLHIAFLLLLATPLPTPAQTKPAEPDPAAKTRLEELRKQNQLRARERAALDRQHYQPAEIAEIEALYQVANKNWRSDEARASLKKLLDKFDKSNRTGCATLYMGQMSTGAERLEYLTRAVEKFSDCYYLDGCQVGGYGRLVLGVTLWENGEKDKARARFDEIRRDYAGAIGHRGDLITEMAEAARKKLGITP